MLKIGLTGGTGSGKSTVAARLAALGATLVDADAIAREVVVPGSEGLAAVAAEFGPTVLAGDGSLDRAALAAVVFADVGRREALEAITRPRIRARTAELVAAAPHDGVLVHDVPLLVEQSLETDYHLVVVVHADPAVRVGRLVRHRGLAPADAQARLAHQATDSRRRRVGDVWLENAGSIGDLTELVDRLWAARLVPFAENLAAGRAAPPGVATLPAHDVGGWGPAAARVLARVGAAAGPRAVRVDHVGPTAVPGGEMAGAIEVQVVVPDAASVAGVAGDLGPAGLVGDSRPAVPPVAATGADAGQACARSADPGLAVRCHVRAQTSPAWREALLLRDWRRATKTDRPGPVPDALHRAGAWAGAAGWTADAAPSA